jgi:type I restriction enzyme S subunit
LSDFATRITRKNNGATDIPLTISAQYGLIDQRDFFSKVVASTDMSGYYLLHRGEYAYNRSTSNDYPFGSIKRLDLYDKGAVSTLYLCFAIKEEVVLSDFAKWYFESSQWYRGVNEICAEGARNHGLLNVPTDGFFNTVHILPSDIEEQSRIAAFLSRIHEKVIQAQEELDELNSLRKGLMQQLFI